MNNEHGIFDAFDAFDAFKLEFDNTDAGFEKFYDQSKEVALLIVGLFDKYNYHPYIIVDAMYRLIAAIIAEGIIPSDQDKMIEALSKQMKKLVKEVTNKP